MPSSSGVPLLFLGQLIRVMDYEFKDEWWQGVTVYGWEREMMVYTKTCQKIQYLQITFSTIIRS
jgi:hypothetical protein